MMPRSRDLVIFMLTMTHTQHQFLLHMCTQDEKILINLCDLGNTKTMYMQLKNLIKEVRLS